MVPARAQHGGKRERKVKTSPEVAAAVVELEKENRRLRSQLGRRESDAIQAMHGEVSEERETAARKIATLERVACDAQRNRAAAVAAQAISVDALTAASQRLMEANMALQSETSRADAATEDARASRRCVGVRSRMVEHRDNKIAALDAELSEQRKLTEKAELLCETRLSSIRRMCGKQGGHPIVNRSNELMGELETEAAWKGEQRMVARALAAVGVFGEDGAISEDAMVKALVTGGWLETVWESQAVWELRMEWVDELKDTLRNVWTPNLTLDLKDKLSISYDKLDELRHSLSHHRVGKQLRPRPWVINPWTNARVSFPQPIVPRSGPAGWTHLVKRMQDEHGLRMDATGRVAQRSFATTVARQLARDQARGLLRDLTDADPLVAVLGADGTGVGKRSITHVATSIAPSYKPGIAQQNEMNLNTIATSVTDDHWGGLDETLCGSAYSTGDLLPANSIAAEINEINRTGHVAGVPAKVVGCFDLVAARGIRGGRGRCACHVEAVTAAERHSIPLITEGSTWDEVAAKMDRAYPFLKAAQMRDDSHTPPEDWDYCAQGPWRCTRAGCSVSFASRAAFLAARSAFRDAKADRSVEGKKLTSARATAYALIHPSQQGEFEAPCTGMNMNDIITDPLHCLMLNLPKVIWKYCFGDRMTNEQRELVAEHLTAIGCPLDVRAKGDGRDANKKWFSGEAFAWFCEGSETSPGLAENIAAIMDIIYLKCPAPAPPVPAAPTDKALNRTKQSGGGGAKKRAGGFSVSSAQGESSADVPAQGESSADVPDTPDTPLQAKLRARYGSHMDTVMLGLNAWGAFAEVYAAWRSVWEEHTLEYAHGRALAFVKVACALSTAMKALSLGKHKSWYVFLTVWVVGRQMAMHGDLWAYGTSPVEQRGARLKKIIRSVVSWRPYHDGWVTVAGPKESAAGSAPRAWIARRKYESCAMMQLLRSCVAQEEMWARSVLAQSALSVSERRMAQTGRTTLIKVERGKGHRLPKLLETVIDLT